MDLFMGGQKQMEEREVLYIHADGVMLRGEEGGWILSKSADTKTSGSPLKQPRLYLPVSKSLFQSPVARRSEGK